MANWPDQLPWWSPNFCVSLHSVPPSPLPHPPPPTNPYITNSNRPLHTDRRLFSNTGGYGYTHAFLTRECAKRKWTRHRVRGVAVSGDRRHSMDLFLRKGLEISWLYRSRALYLIVYVCSIVRSSIPSDVEGPQEEKLICNPFSFSVYFKKKTSDVADSRCHALKKIREFKML